MKEVNWDKPAVKALLGSESKRYCSTPSSYLLNIETAAQWQKYTLKCPYINLQYVEGYDLIIDFPTDENLIFWIDDIRFTPEWNI